MKKILALCASILLLAVGALVWRAAKPKHFGEPFAGAPKAGLAELLAAPEKFLERDVALEDTVTRQCPLTGCWFYFKTPEGRELKIELGAVVAGLPVNKGARARVEGRLKKQGSDFVFHGNGVEFGGRPAAAPASKEELAKQAFPEVRPMPDGYPVNYCVVGGEKLGSMGEPIAYVHEGRTVKFCCEGCVDQFKADPRKYFSILDQAVAQARSQNAPSQEKAP